MYRKQPYIHRILHIRLNTFSLHRRLNTFRVFSDMQKEVKYAERNSLIQKSLKTLLLKKFETQIQGTSLDILRLISDVNFLNIFFKNLL